QGAGGGAIQDRDVALVGGDRGHAFRGVRQGGGEHEVGDRAFEDGRGAQVDRRGGDRVVDVRGQGDAADHQAPYNAVCGAGVRRVQLGGRLALVLYTTLFRSQGAGGGAIQDRDVALVGGDRGHAFRGVRQGGGEHEVGDRAFEDGRGAQVDRRGGDRVVDV